MKWIIISAIAAALVRTTPAALVVNGDFESGLNGWNHSSDVTTTPSDFGQAARLTIDPILQTSFIKQIVGTIGQTYVVDFDVKMTGGGGSWDAFYDGVTLLQDFGTGPTTFSHYRFTVTPTSTPTLLFDFYQATEAGAMLLDNVSVVAVPEPSNLIAGLVPLAALVMRRSRKQLSDSTSETDPVKAAILNPGKS